MVSMDLEALEMKGYTTFPKTPALLETYHQIVWYHIQDTCWSGGRLCKESQCILLHSSVQYMGNI